MENYLYDAFISYRHLQLDKAVAKRLHTLIETYHIPKSVQKLSGKKKMGKVFRDEEELPLATSLSDNIRTALDASQWLIVVCTPALLESRWCLFEIDYFISLGRRDRILLVLADGTPDTSFPPQLRSRTVDGQTVSVEPLAANIVAEDTAGSLRLLNREKLRILAPMLGVNYDDLRRRARRRRIRLIAALTASVLLIGTALGVFLTLNRIRTEALRREAAEQARIAEEERVRAEEERVRAEEEQRQKEQERKNAVYSDLGERMERAGAALAESEKRSAVNILLEAVRISDENDGMRRTELIALLRRALYIEPFSVIARFNNRNLRVNDITVSPDGTRAAGVVNSNSVALIDLNANEILYQVTAGKTMLTKLQFSADGSRFLALSDYGQTVVVWNASDGSEAFSYTSRQNSPYHIANAFFWKDAKTILVQDMAEFYLVSEDGTQTLFYTVGEQMDEYEPDRNLISYITGRTISEMYNFLTDDYSGMPVVLSADRSRILIGGRDGSTAAIVLDDTGKRVSLPGVVINGVQYKMPGVFSEKWAMSPDGRTVSCISLIGVLFGWDTDTGELLYLRGFEYAQGFDFSAIAFSADSTRIAYTAEDQLYVTDARTDEIALQASIDETSYVPELAFSEDGKYLLMTNQSMFIINAETWALELLESAEFGENYNNIVPLENAFLITRFDGTANFYSMPAIASVTAADAFDGTLCEPVPQFLPGKDLKLFGEHELSQTYLQTSGGGETAPQLILARGGATAALAYPDGAIELFDTDGDGSVKTMIGELSSKPEAVAISETVLVASDQAARLLFYDLEKGAVRSIATPGAVYGAFAFDPEGTLLMARTASADRIDVYSVETAELLFSMRAANETFAEFAFSADGAFAVGKTDSGRYVIGNLWKDEATLLERAQALTASMQ